MKKRSREVNVFSVSALDLFASALGAFILMSLIFMVFFSMTSSAATTSEQIDRALAECRARAEAMVERSALAACEDLAASAEKERADLARELASVRVPDLDLVICLDITGSMREQIEGLKREITDLARVLDRLAPTAGVGIVAFGDVRYDLPIHQHEIVATTRMASLLRFVNGIEPGMGQGNGGNEDAEEALYAGLEAAVAMNWRPVSERRYVIVITDAPPYSHEEEAARRSARSFAGTGNGHVSAVMVGRTDAEGFLRELAREGDGEFVNGLGGQTILASILLAIIDG